MDEKYSYANKSVRELHVPNHTHKKKHTGDKHCPHNVGCCRIT